MAVSVVWSRQFVDQRLPDANGDLLFAFLQYMYDSHIGS
jgi:hypothetical protein